MEKKNGQIPNWEVVGTRLKQMRILFDETQEELSKVLHISRSCLANYECSRRKMPRDIIKQASMHFGVQESFLLGLTSHIIPTRTNKSIADISNALTQDGKLDISKIPLSGRLALIAYYQYLKNPTDLISETEWDSKEKEKYTEKEEKN